MWVRTLLAPWWLRTGFAFVFVVACGAVGVLAPSMVGESNHLPAAGIALMLGAALVVAALIATAMGQSRRLYLEALSPVSTADERSKAIEASWRGPVPHNPRVREAAGNLARLLASSQSTNRGLSFVGYAVMAIVFPMNVVVAVLDDEPARAVLFTVLGLVVVCAAARSWWSVRRLRTRAQMLMSACDRP